MFAINGHSISQHTSQALLVLSFNLFILGGKLPSCIYAQALVQLNQVHVHLLMYTQLWYNAN